MIDTPHSTVSPPDHLKETCAEIEYLLTTTFPTHRIHVNLSQSDFAVPPRAHCARRDAPLVALGDTLSFLGTYVLGATSATAPVVTVSTCLAGPVTAEQIEAFDAATGLRSKKAQKALRLSPFWFETAKYFLEKRRQKRLYSSHKWTALAAPDLMFTPAFAHPWQSSSDKPCILVGLHWLEHGGAEKLGLQTINWALEAGLRVIVITQNDALHRLADALPDHPDCTFLRMDRYVPADHTAVFLRNLVLRENIVGAHIHHCLPLYEALPLMKAARPELCVISSTHIVEYENGGFPRVDGVWTHFIDHHHTISHQLSDVLQERFGAGGRTVMGRILEREASDATTTVAFPESIDTGALKIAFVGRMSHQKRPLLLAYQMRKIRKWAKRKRVDIQFDIVGEGPYLDAFKTCLSAFRLTDMTTLHPANADVPALLQGADIMLLPSANEGLALVCYEAIQNGTIPISTDVGAQGELMPSELMVDPNPLKLTGETVKIIDKLYRQPAFYTAMIAALTERYAAVKADPTAQEVLMPIYTSVLEKARGSTS